MKLVAFVSVNKTTYYLVFYKLHLLFKVLLKVRSEMSFKNTN